MDLSSSSACCLQQQQHNLRPTFRHQHRSLSCKAVLLRSRTVPKTVSSSFELLSYTPSISQPLTSPATPAAGQRSSLYACAPQSAVPQPDSLHSALQLQPHRSCQSCHRPRSKCHSSSGSEGFINHVDAFAGTQAGNAVEPETSQSQQTQPAESTATTQQDATHKESGMPEVPWGLDKVFQVMFLWFLGYLIIGSIGVPLALSVLGLDTGTLSIKGQAFLHLVTDLSQLALIICILRFCLREYRPRALGLFPMKAVKLMDVLTLAAVSCVAFPTINYVAQQAVAWFPADSDVWASHLEHSLSLGDTWTTAAYFGVVSLCCPVWEEIIFRGFLLASLMKNQSKVTAVIGSSVIFALCHIKSQTVIPLTLLGILFSVVFLHFKNLWPPVILHSCWNVYVLYCMLYKPF